MSDEKQTHSWMTAVDAARVLKMTPRHVHRYGTSGQIKTRRAGRRVLYSSADVARLADELGVDVRSEAIVKQDPTERMIEVFSQQNVRLDGIQASAQRAEETAQQTVEALRRIEQRLATPPPPAAPPAPTPALPMAVTVAIIVMAAAIVVLAIVLLVR